jgi:hypothetical protein
VIAIEIPGAVARTVLVEREPFVQRQADAGGGRALDLARHQIILQSRAIPYNRPQRHATLEVPILSA